MPTTRRSSLIGEPVAWLEAALVVDQHEPFFFDHPLDHVPGTLQLFGLLDFVRTATGLELGYERGTRLQLSIEFLAFCELGREARLRCSEVANTQSRTWNIRVEQDGYVACSGQLKLINEPGNTETVPSSAEHANLGQGTDNDEAERIPAHYVNRVNPKNVMIGKPQTGDSGLLQVSIVSPCQGHFLQRAGHDGHGVEVLIEAAREVGVLLENREFGRKGEIQMILESISADIPCGLPRIPLTLRATRTERRGRRVWHDVDIISHSEMAILGGFRLTARTVTKAAYSRMRGTQ